MSSSRSTGKTLDKKVTLRPKSGDQLAAKDKDEKKDDSEINEETPKSVSFAALGFTVRALSAQEKTAMNVETGVVVSEVKPFGEANKRGIGPR